MGHCCFTLHKGTSLCRIFSLILRSIGSKEVDSIDSYQNTKASILRSYVIIIACVSCLSGCYSLSQEKFETYVSKNVSAGMSLSSVSNRLRIDGFICDSQSYRPMTSCTRSFNNLPTLQNCLERINLYPSQDNINVERVETLQITCVGF